MLDAISGMVCTVVEKRANNMECDIKALVDDHSKGVKKELTGICLCIQNKKCSNSFNLLPFTRNI